MDYIWVAVTFVVALASAGKGLQVVAMTQVGSSEPNKHNDDEKARKNFLALLKEARREIILNDDGGPSPTSNPSIYDSEEVVDAIARKLERTPRFRGFRVRCLFSNQQPTLFTQQFGEHDRVEIRYRDKRSQEHYKIIDQRKAYVSCHRENSSDRSYKFIECPGGFLGFFAGPARKAALGRYLNDFAAHV